MFAASRNGVARTVSRFPFPGHSIPSFHSSARSLVKIGDKIPSIELQEGSPGNKVNIANELVGRGIIIGMCIQIFCIMVRSGYWRSDFASAHLLK
jgi:hypothetical protein